MLTFSFIVQTENLNDLDEILSQTLQSALMSEKETSNISCNSENFQKSKKKFTSKRARSDPAIRLGKYFKKNMLFESTKLLLIFFVNT
jgi:hypothetical protein